MNDRSTLSPAAEAGVGRRTVEGREHVFPGRESCRSILVADEGRLTARLPPDAEHQANVRSGRQAEIELLAMSPQCFTLPQHDTNPTFAVDNTT